MKLMAPVNLLESVPPEAKTVNIDAVIIEERWQTPCKFPILDFNGIGRLERNSNLIGGDPATGEEVVGYCRYEGVYCRRQRS